MSDFDEVEVTTTLVQATGEAAAVAYPDWTYGVSTRVLPSRGVGTTIVVAYQSSEGKVADLWDHRDLKRLIRKSSTALLDAQGVECMGLKCTVARSGQFRIEYSYDIDEAIKWANEVFSGLPPAELVEVLRPRDL
ncbi:hypothetical protein [Nocardia sp. GTS18]|uniref:hypothetical protein n=1 Tax=Nocardia sp. GTS18 TaxID=1778064 RepID=UPI0015EEF422|nr:hypothetical protein [Nocardia sp. GTS18]